MNLADMSRPLCGMLDGSTQNVQVAFNRAALLSERPNKTPIYVSGVTDTRNFLPWLTTLCPSSLSYQITGKKLMIVPRTVDGFRSTVSACDPLMEQESKFNVFSLYKDCCMRLLIKNLCRQFPDDVVRGELDALGIRVQGILQLRYGPLTRKLILHFIVVSAGTWIIKGDFWHCAQ
jgi:hypothetical protein